VTKDEISAEVKETYTDLSVILDRWEKSIGQEQGRPDDDPLSVAYVGIMLARDSLGQLMGQMLLEEQTARMKVVKGETP
jgi:hypothetical protein